MPLVITALAALAVFLIAVGILYTANRGKIAEKRRVDSLFNGSRPRKSAVRSMLVRNNAQKSGSQPTRRGFEKLADELYVAGIALRPEEFVLLWAVCAVIAPAIFLFFGVNTTICIGIAVLGAAAPLAYTKFKRHQRLSKFDKQLIDALAVICNSLRAGLSFLTAMNTIASEMEDPIAREFGRVYKECQMGMPMEASFSRLIQRTGNQDLELICSAVIIQKQIGGNLADVLENISDTITQRVKLRGEVKTMTASGSMSGYIIGALPILLLLALTFVNPGYVNMFFYTSTGRIMLVISAVLEIIGFIIVKKIITIKM